MEFYPIICPSFKRRFIDVTCPLFLNNIWLLKTLPVSSLYFLRLLNYDGWQFDFLLSSLHAFELLYLSHLILMSFVSLFFLVSVSRIVQMASSSSHNTGHTEGTEVLNTPSGNVHIFAFSSCLRCRLYPVRLLSLPG